MIMKPTLRQTLVIPSLLLGSMMLAGCPEDGPVEEAGEKVDEAVDEAGDKLDDAADEVKEAGEEIKESVDGDSN